MFSIFAAFMIIIASLALVDCTLVTHEDVRTMEMIDRSNKQIKSLDESHVRCTESPVSQRDVTGCHGAYIQHR
jgi:hypothetical protein